MRSEEEIKLARGYLNTMLELLKGCKGRNLYTFYETQRDMLNFVLNEEGNYSDLGEGFPEIATQISRVVYDNCKDAPHDIGLTVLKEIFRK